MITSQISPLAPNKKASGRPVTCWLPSLYCNVKSLCSWLLSYVNIWS